MYPAWRRTSAGFLPALVLFYLAATSSSFSEALANCRPEARCVSLRRCPHLLRLIADPSKRAAVTNAICGFSGTQAKVCCNFRAQLSTLSPYLQPNQGPRPPASYFATARPSASASLKGQSTRKTDTLSALSGYTATMSQPDPAAVDEAPTSTAARDSLLPTTCGLSAALSRIYGGLFTGLAENPWVAAIGYANPRNRFEPPSFKCSGALINNRYIVTAAHCVGYKDNLGGVWNISVIRLGEWRLSSDPDCSEGVCGAPVTEVAVEEVIPHPNYNKNFRYSDDIALIRIKEAVDFTVSVRPLCLPPPVLRPADVAVGQTVTATGWGMTSDQVDSDVLMSVTLPIASPFRCYKVFPRNFKINGSQMCIGGVEGQDTCMGDSGSPVVKTSRLGHQYLLAITSFGNHRCGMDGYPAVYTSVPHYAAWIRGALRE